MGENEQTAKEEQELSWNEVKEMISQLIQESPDEGISSLSIFYFVLLTTFEKHIF